MPYDRFVTLQLAADQLQPAPAAGDLAALGFLTVGKWFTGNLHDVIDDQIDVVTRGLLGLSLQCARCHDHKYDPLLTADYYSLYGLLAASQLPLDGTGLFGELPLVEPPPLDPAAEQSCREQLAAIERSLAARQAEIQAEYATPDRIAQYLLVAQGLAAKSDQEQRDAIQRSDLHPEILQRWVRLVKRTAKEPQPIFGPWHAFAQLGHAEFASRAAEIVAAERAKPLNPHVAAMLATPPTSQADLAYRYADLLLRFDGSTQLHANEDEALRQVLRAGDSPVLLQLQELGPFLSREENEQLMAQRQSVLAELARLPAAADQYFWCVKDSAPQLTELSEWLRERRATVVADLGRPERIAQYLLAAHEAREAEEQRLRSIANKQKLSERMLRRWIGVLARAAAAEDRVFAPWRRFAALGDEGFADKAAAVTAELPGIQPDPLVAELFASPPASLREVAERYAGLLTRIDADESSSADPCAAAVRQLVTGADALTRIAPREADDFFSLKDRDELRGKDRNLARTYIDHPGAAGRSMIVRELAGDYRQPIFVRGNPNALGPLAPGRWLAVLSADDDLPLAAGQGRRQVAEAMFGTGRALTARVIVNRVWQHHFGRGLVDTPSDFGARFGPQPSRAARLARGPVHRRRLVAQAIAPPDHALGRLPAVERRQSGLSPGRSGKSPALADEPAAVGLRGAPRFAARGLG